MQTSDSMDKMYQPSSNFLKAVAADEVPLTGPAPANANLRRLIAMTRDEDRSNRDWATFLLAQKRLDMIEVREALLQAADDEDEAVRAEAVLGLAQLDKQLALPLVKRELSSESITVPILEAAALLADESLVADLQDFTAPSRDVFMDGLVRAALQACETGQPKWL